MSDPHCNSTGPQPSTGTQPSAASVSDPDCISTGPQVPCSQQVADEHRAANGTAAGLQSSQWVCSWPSVHGYSTYSSGALPCAGTKGPQKGSDYGALCISFVSVRWSLADDCGLVTLDMTAIGPGEINVATEFHDWICAEISLWS